MSSTLSEGQKLIRKPLISPFKERSANDKVSYQYFGLVYFIVSKRVIPRFYTVNYCHSLKQTCPNKGLWAKVEL